MKKIIYFLLLILWLSIIFILSNQNGEISGNNSGNLIKETLEIIYNLFNLSKDNLNNVFNIIHEPIRECAHAFEYFVLSFLTYKNLENFNIKKNKCLITIILCFICSLLDEVHQIFIIGRTFQFIDIYIDLLGSILMILIIKITYNYKEEK